MTLPQFEILPYRDQNSRARAGFILRRLDTGELYFSGFSTRRAAETISQTCSLSPRFWVSRPQLVNFGLYSQFALSLSRERI